MTQFLTTHVDKSLSATGAWTDIDLSSDIPASATGAIFEIVNLSTTTPRLWGIRKNGSTDDRYEDLRANGHIFAIIGVDSNRKCEGKIESTTVDFHLVGYTESDATFFTNAYSKSQYISGAWTDLDLSSEIPAGANAAIFEIVNPTVSNISFGLRKNGSTDYRYRDLLGDSHQFFIVSVDANRKCEFKIEYTNIGFYLIGYLTGGSHETNGIDRSLGTFDEYIDITESSAPSGCPGVWVDFEVSGGGIGSNYAARKKGVTADIYKYPQSWTSQIFVGLDSSKKWQGKIAFGNYDFYTVGYFGTGAVPITKESSVGLTVVERHTKASSIGISVQETETKASSIGLSISKPVTKASSIGISVLETKTKASSIGLRVVTRQTKASSIGVSVQETETKASSIGLRIITRQTKASSIGISVLETKTKASSISLSVQAEGTKVSTLGLTVANQKKKYSSVGLTITGTNTKTSSLGLSVKETNTHESSLGVSVVDTATKVSTAGLRIVDRHIKESSASLTVKATYTKESSAGLCIVTPQSKASSVGLTISGANTLISSVGLTIYESALKKGLFYAKLGDTILEAIEPESFRISEEINRIPSYEFEVANSEVNRAAIAANPTALLKIYWQHHGIENHIFTGIINADGIEYVSLTNIRITGFSSYVKLGWPLFKHLDSEDAESVNTVFDFHGTYTDYTTEANNATINDVLPTFGGIDHSFYVGEANPFWGLQLKYSTPGIPAGAVIAIEFSKGAGVWGELDVLDETNAFSEPAGTYDFIIAHPPSDWARNTVDGISKFWLRWRVVSGAYTTSPKLDQIHTVNVDIYRVFYIATSARAILLDVLSDTEYTMDTTDVCPEDEINLFAEYESPLRVIAAIPAALTWTDTDGSKKSYQWWIDEAKKVHMKKKRGTSHPDDITGDLTIFNNLLDYFNVSNRLIGFAKRDGLSQIRAIVENKASQTTHALREFAVPKTELGKYITLKESLEKDIAISKDPMQRLKGSVTTEFWGLRGYEVGDTITLHQGEWVVEEGEFQIVKVDKGPILTQLNLGISREHLEGLKSNLKRAFDINNVQMHGSTTLLNFGPETMNYERISAEEVHSAKLEVEIPTDVTKLYKVLISWTLGNYVASVGPHTDEGGGHDHSGFAGSGGGVESTFPGAGGDFIPEILADGGFIPSMLGKAHTHYLYNELHIQHSSGTFYEIASDYVQGLNHRHSGGGTGYSNSNASALIPPLYMGSACTSGRCVTGVYDSSFATSSHYHQNSDTGYTSPNAWVETILRSYVQYINPTIIAEFTNTEDPAHLHEGVAESDHGHAGVYHGTHFDHLIPAILPHIDHQITTAIGFTMDLLYHIYETSGGTTMELLINSEKVAEYTTAQTEVRVDGYMTSGKNTIELQPIGIETNKKGGATIWGSGIAFTEPKKF